MFETDIHDLFLVECIIHMEGNALWILEVLQCPYVVTASFCESFVSLFFSYQLHY